MKMSTRVYVGGLNHRCREKDIERHFRRYGRLREISLKNGFAFCEFEDYRDADDACYELNGKEFMGERITVEIAKGTPHGRDRDRWGSGGGGGGRRDRSPRRGGGGGGGARFSRDSRGRPVWLDKYGPPTRTDYRLVIENLSSRVSWQDLKDYMRQAGDVTYADAHKTRRNEGCVEFANYADLKTALDKLDGTELNGRKIRLVEDKGSGRKRSRSRSRSGSRSRSRSRHRTRSKTRSRSKSGGRDGSRSRSRSRDARSRSRSADRRSRSPDRRSRSKDRNGDSGSKRSESRSRSRSPSRDRERQHSRSRSRSRSRSCDKDESMQEDAKAGEISKEGDETDARPPGEDEFDQ